jgi:hypothetical protein
MAYIKPKFLSIGASTDPDVVGYKVYWAVPPGTIVYNPENGVNVGLTTKIALPLAGMPNIDGKLTIGVTAIDDVGNESDPAEGTFPFDFIPPTGPTSLSVSDT